MRYPAKLKYLSLTILFSLLLTGCFGRTKSVYVLPGTATTVREWIKDAKVAVPGADGQLQETVTDIPPGAIVLMPKDK